VSRRKSTSPRHAGIAMLDFLVHVRDHLTLAGSALSAAVLFAVPLGAMLARSPGARGLGLAVVGTARVVPSLAVLALMLPLIGIGFLPALVALVLLAIPPIAINTDLGLRGVPEPVSEAARGLGMDARQVRARIEWPLALPLVFAGIRTAAVEVIASATLAAFIGGGGLGEYIVNGLAEADTSQLLEGALAVGALALTAEGLLGLVERRLTARIGAQTGAA
jgi:osmoprotectant transport system permease protein